MYSDQEIIPRDNTEPLMTSTNLSIRPQNFSANPQLNLKSVGKAITSHFHKIMLASPMDDASSNSSDSDSEDVPFQPSMQLQGLKVA